MYALTQHWHVLVPPEALYGGLGAALAIGAIAGLYPGYASRPSFPDPGATHHMTTAALCPLMRSECGWKSKSSVVTRRASTNGLLLILLWPDVGRGR